MSSGVAVTAGTVMTGDPNPSGPCESSHSATWTALKEVSAMKRTAPMSPFWNSRLSRTFFNPSTIRRYTTVALIVGLVTLVCFLWAVAAGAYNYPHAANLFTHPPFRAFLVILTWSLIYKLLTGTTDPGLGGRYGFERNAARVSRITVIAITTLLTVTALLPALLGH